MDENTTRQCNPSLPLELVGDAQKIKGDAIGNTLYSQCWVLKVLMKLAQLSDEGLFDEDLEKDLCLLWDMTVEEDVVWFLVENNILDHIVFILQKEQEPRLMEILVGMLANLCVVAEVCHRATSSTPVCELMVRMLFCVDTLTLVQLMRLYITCLQRLRNSKENQQEGNAILDDNEKSSEKMYLNSERDCSNNQSGSQLCEAESSGKLCSDKQSNEIFFNMLLNTDCWYNQITFLLQSSTNRTLLLSMLQMLDDLYRTIVDCEIFLPSVCTTEMISAIVEALKELKAGVSASGVDEVSRKAVFHSISVLSNFVDSEPGTAALCEMSDVLVTYVCSHVEEDCLCSSLSVDCVQFIMHCLNIFGCTFASLTSKTDVTCWTVSLLGHLTERVADRQKSLCGEDGFEAKDKEEEERYFNSDELILAVEEFCLFIAKFLSGNSNNVKWSEIEDVIQDRCESEHLEMLRLVIHKHSFEEQTVCTENT